MFAKFCVITGLIACTLLDLLGCTREPSVREEESAIRAVLNSLALGITNRNVDALKGFWAQDATIVEGQEHYLSWPSYRDHHLKPEFAELSDAQWVLEEVSIRVEGRMAWAHFRVLFGAVQRNGQRPAGQTWGTAILIKTREGWKIAQLHLS